jgi:linoleoyl-CoA desaturase
MTTATARAGDISSEYAPPKFASTDRFLHSVRKRVDAYFEAQGISRRDSPRMYLKSATILGTFFGTYLVLLLAAPPWYLAVPLAVLLGLALAAIGFNIQHDGGHKAFSRRPWVNRLMAMTLDLVGGSSYMWDWKHNSIHHTYTNITGHDDDIDLGYMARLSPHQKHLWFHRLQGIYLWVAYGFLAIKWHFYDDFKIYFISKLGDKPIPRPKGVDLLIFVAGKIFFFCMAFVIPMLLHPWWAVLGIYAIAACVSGIVLSVVFQLAHCVEIAEFPMPVVTPTGEKRMQNGWAVHQVQTTVNFCRGNRFVTWFVGGLNYQVEHHLFPKISHVHYEAVSRIVEDVCAEFQLCYLSHRSFFSALGSHYRWLRAMGRPTPAPAGPSPLAEAITRCSPPAYAQSQ